jgi:hypothetical protein
VLMWPNGAGLVSNSQLGSALRWSVATIGQLRAHHNDASGSSQSISACFQRNAGTVSVLG